MCFSIVSIAAASTPALASVLCSFADRFQRELPERLEVREKREASEWCRKNEEMWEDREEWNKERGRKRKEEMELKEVKTSLEPNYTD